VDVEATLAKPLPDGTGKIYLFRISSVPLLAVSDVLIDNEKVGVLRNKGTVICQMSTGKHRLVLPGGSLTGVKSAQVEFDIISGQRVFFLYTIGSPNLKDLKITFSGGTAVPYGMSSPGKIIRVTEDEWRRQRLE